MENIKACWTLNQKDIPRRISFKPWIGEQMARLWFNAVTFGFLGHPSTICRSYGAGRFPQMNADCRYALDTGCWFIDPGCFDWWLLPRLNPPAADRKRYWTGQAGFFRLFFCIWNFRKKFQMNNRLCRKEKLYLPPICWNCGTMVKYWYLIFLWVLCVLVFFYWSGLFF